MKMLQLIVLLVLAVVGGTLAGHVWNLPVNQALFMGLPPALALIVWAIINSD